MNVRAMMSSPFVLKPPMRGAARRFQHEAEGRQQRSVVLLVHQACHALCWLALSKVLTADRVPQLDTRR